MKNISVLVCFLTSVVLYGCGDRKAFHVEVDNPVELSSERMRTVGGNLLYIEEGDVTGQTGCLKFSLGSGTSGVIEYFSCSAKAPEGQAIIFGLETAREETCLGSSQYYLPVTPSALLTTAGNISLSASQHVRISVPKDGYVRYTASRTGGTSETIEINCFFDGFNNIN